jgi:hypothetical protein
VCFIAVEHFLALYVYVTYLEETDFLFDRLHFSYELDFYGSFYAGIVSFVCSLVTALIVYMDDTIYHVAKPKLDYNNDLFYYDDEYNDFTKYNYSPYAEDGGEQYGEWYSGEGYNPTAKLHGHWYFGEEYAPIDAEYDNSVFDVQYDEQSDQRVAECNDLQSNMAAVDNSVTYDEWCESDSLLHPEH